MLQGSESTVFLTAGGVRALQKLGRYTDTKRGSYLVVKLPLEAMDRAADLRQDLEEAYTIPARRRVAAYSRGIHGWDFLPLCGGFFFVLRYVVACMDPLGGPNRA